MSDPFPIKDMLKSYRETESNSTSQLDSEIMQSIRQISNIKNHPNPFLKWALRCFHLTLAMLTLYVVYSLYVILSIDQSIHPIWHILPLILVLAGIVSIKTIR